MPRSPVGGLSLLAAWCGAIACAPTAISPGIMRFSPDLGSSMLGLSTGPRLSVPVAAERTNAISTFPGDATSFALPQWSVAYDLGLSRPLGNGFALHFGGSGEFYYPFPLPGYGVYVGVSRYFQFGKLSLAPAVSIRGSTDFGLSSFGGPGSFVGAEATTTIAWHPEPGVAIGLVPFFSAQEVWSGKANSPGTYAGLVFAVHVETGPDVFEITGGFGRVFMPNVPSWNVPLIGIRAGR